MKYIPALWFKTLIVGFLLSSSAYAVSLEEEAKKAFLDTLTNHNWITICGDSYYIHIDGNNKEKWAIFQGKEFSVELKPEQISYAAKLNGLEWKGSGKLQQKAIRMYTPQDKWSPWEAPERMESNPDLLSLSKKDGKWTVEPITFLRVSGEPLDCKKIEAMTK